MTDQIEFRHISIQIVKKIKLSINFFFIIGIIELNNKDNFIIKFKSN